MSRLSPRHVGPAPDLPSDVRALPARPSLEFERKQARRLLRQLHAGDPEALDRVRAKLQRAHDRSPDEFRLADAQFTIAREYGFSSWPKLTEYFETLARHVASGGLRQGHGRDAHELWARSIVTRHGNRRMETAEALAAFVPRFYGRSPAEIFASEFTIDEARLVHARMNRYPSWDVLLDEDGRPDEWERETSPLRKALKAVREADAEAFSTLVKAHPELLTTTVPGQAGNIELASMALGSHVRSHSPEFHRTVQWLGARVDLQSTLNWLLLGHLRMTVESVRLLLDAGADPGWIAPNGFSVLEHAIVRYWNGAAVDLIAARTRAPRSFWVAAGLGDVQSVKGYIERDGAPTDAARRHRPDFTALELGWMPMNPAADDQTVVWEGSIVAALNQRFAVLDVLLDRGFPIDHMVWGPTLLQLAVGNGWVPLAEYLVRRGADVTLEGRPNGSARHIAEQGFLNPHGHPEKRRLLELCGGRDPEVLVRERDEQRAKRVMQTHPTVEEAFVLAKQDAIRQGRDAVGSENLLIALLRQGKLPLQILSAAGVDLERLRAQLADRLEATGDPPPPEMTTDPAATALLLAARAEAERRKHDTLNTLHLFVALLATAEPVVLALIEPAGARRERLHAEVDRFLGNW